MKQRDDQNVEGQILVSLARQSLEHRLAGGPAPMKPAQDSLGEKAAVFVTITKKGQLRGCIGNLVAVRPLWQSVCENAVNAALNDRRFTPLTAKELAEVDLQVSVLSQARELEYEDAEQLKTLLRPGVDGVILGDGQQSATFLPQVWQQLPRVEDFLGHLCRKAGLPETGWRQKKLRIQVYEVRYYSEAKE